MIDSLIAAYGPILGLLLPIALVVFAALLGLVIVNERRRY